MRTWNKALRMFLAGFVLPFVLLVIVRYDSGRTCCHEEFRLSRLLKGVDGR